MKLVTDNVAGMNEVADLDVEERPARKGRRGGDLLWEMNDRFGRACAMRIKDHHGKPTSFGMVYGWDNDNGDWSPVRPVSDRYTPIATGEVIDLIRERMGGRLVKEVGEKNRIERFGTTQMIQIPLEDEIELPGLPFDREHPWTNFRDTPGHKKVDIVKPMITIRNAYDATSSIGVNFGIWRQICSNGAKIMLAGLNIKAIHTRHEIARVVDEVAKADLQGSADFVKHLNTRKLDKADINRIIKSIPEKHAKELKTYAALGGNTAWAVMNGLSYLQSHVYSVARGRQLDGAITAVQKLAA